MTRSIIPFHKFYDAFHVPETMKIVDEKDQEINIITNIRKLNIIVGANDSGKSYLMRELFKQINPPKIQNASDTVKTDVIELYRDLCDSINPLMDKAYPKVSQTNWSIIISGTNGVFSTHSDYLTGIIEKKSPISEQEIYNTINYISRFLDSCKQAGENDIKISLTKYKESGEITESSNDVFDLDEDTLNKIIEKLNDFIDEISKFVFNKELESERINKFNHYFIYQFRSLIRDYFNNIPFDYYRTHVYDSTSFSNGVSRLHQPDLKDDFYQLYVRNGSSLYNEFNVQNSNLNGRKKLHSFESFLSSEIFESKEVLLHPSNTDSEQIKKPFQEFQIQIGEDEPRFIHELGTGLQMIIILTWCLFEIDYGVIFIEEPELFIHPGLQRQLMNIYTKHPRSERFLFFIATHSNHIIDIAQYEPDLCSVFMIKKKIKDDKPCFVLRNFREDEVIQSLGITQSSLFLANCSIWVEGNTDWKYIRSWFELFLLTKEPKDHFKEGLHYTFVEYGGSLIDHWKFSEELESDIDEKEELKSGAKVRLKSTKVSRYSFVIADRGDINNDKNKKRIEKLTERIGTENFYLTEGYEIENLLAVEVIADYMKEKGEVPNEKAAIKKFVMELKEKIKTLALGKSIDTVLKNNKNEYHKKFKNSQFKGEFCNQIIKIIRDKGLKAKQIAEESKVKVNSSTFAGIISDEGWSLCEKIYEFIKRNNPS